MDTFNIGDKVRVTDFYRQNYPSWDMKEEEATVVSVKKFKVYAAQLAKEDKPMFQNRYGIQFEYDMYELHVDIKGHIFIVSQFGFNAG